jgi:hypothetical protein
MLDRPVNIPQVADITAPALTSRFSYRKTSTIYGFEFIGSKFRNRAFGGYCIHVHRIISKLVLAGTPLPSIPLILSCNASQGILAILGSEFRWRTPFVELHF